MRMATNVALLATLVAGGVGGVVVLGTSVPDPETSVVSLPSGRMVEVIHTGVEEASPHTWKFHYRTRESMEKPGAVSCEVDGLWKELRTKAEAAGATEAIVEAQSFSRHFGLDGWRPVMLSHRSTGFLFRKNENGTWKNVGGSSCEV